MEFYEKHKNYPKAKSITLVTKTDLQVGGLTTCKNGDTWTKKLFADLNVKKTLEPGTKCCIRYMLKSFDSYYVYIMIHGWTQVKIAQLENFFDLKDKDLTKTVVLDYTAFSAEEKINMLLTYYPQFADNLSKTDTLTLAFIKNQDLPEVEKKYSIDSSQKYKLKKEPELYKEKLLKNLEILINTPVQNIQENSKNEG